MATTGKTFFQRFSERCRFKSSKALVDFMINVDSRIDLFKRYNTNCILELMFLAVLPAYGKRRIAEQLITSTLELCQDLKQGRNVRMAVTIYGKNDLTNDHTVPTVVSSILTSVYSQRICTKLEFERLLEIPYDECEFNEVKYSERIDRVHSHCVLMAKKL
jgi:GNAT superfamily N-acetyltransferase